MEGLVMSHATSIDNHVRPLSSASLVPALSVAEPIRIGQKRLLHLST